jgi:hypothetical protein
MRTAILHYHLRPGGVTRVIEMAEDALNAAGCEVLVCCGEKPPPECRVQSVAVVPELAYGVSAGGADGIRVGVDRACRKRWGRTADILHVHNHSLGKNASLPAAVAAWAGEGRALILQMHDFAENARPANYRLLREEFGECLARVLYPSGGNVRLATLTSHAAQKLRMAGAGPVVLPNPVKVPERRQAISAADFSGECLVVYPSRGIGRKNVGEFLLHAAHAPHGEVYAITSRPTGGVEGTAFLAWQEFADRLGLPVVFDAAGKLGAGVYDFLHGADACVTTSMEEGFGMAFLEPWVAGRGLAGRNLPGVTADFEAEGINLSHLYESVPVELDPASIRALTEEISRTVESSLLAYGRPSSSGLITNARQAVLSEKTADFGRLPSHLQQKLIANRQLPSPPPIQFPTKAMVAENQNAIQAFCDPDLYGQKLSALYTDTLAQSPSAEFIDPAKVLDACLDFHGFAFCLRLDSK